MEAVQAALVHVFDDGTYARTLDRWGLAGESVEEPVINPDVAS